MALLGASAVATAGVQTTPAAAPFPGPLPGRPHTLSPLGAAVGTHPRQLVFQMTFVTGGAPVSQGPAKNQGSPGARNQTNLHCNLRSATYWWCIWLLEKT